MLGRHALRCNSLAMRRRLLSTAREWPSTAVIGVGQLGAAVASNLLRNKVPLTLYDLQGDKNVPTALKNSLAGASWASSAKEAAERADVVITALPRPEHVTAAFQGSTGILAGLRSGATWIEHSTTDFENTAKVCAVRAFGRSGGQADRRAGGWTWQAATRNAQRATRNAQRARTLMTRCASLSRLKAQAQSRRR